MTTPDRPLRDLIEAACTLHDTLQSWHKADEALRAVRAGVTGFSPEAVLAKVALVDALYYTNVAAIVRVADHFHKILKSSDPKSAGPSLVQDLAAAPQGGNETRKVLRLSLAAKFAHFFIDEERFPIYDKYAVRMVAKHAGVPASKLRGNYPDFTAGFNALAEAAGLHSRRRRLDRYLWIQGQYEEWSRTGKTTSTDLAAMFKQGAWPPTIAKP